MREGFVLTAAEGGGAGVTGRESAKTASGHGGGGDAGLADPVPAKGHSPHQAHPREHAFQLGILVADDHPFFREGVRAWVDRQPQLRYCGEINSKSGLREAIRSAQPDLVLLNLALERQDPAGAVRRLRREFPQVRLLVLIDKDQVLAGESALRAGAHGLITKDQDPQDFLLALTTVQQGDIYLNKSLTALMLKKAYFGERTDDVTGRLSGRELQIFGLLGQGYGTREIASKLGLSRRTVNVHRENIKHKLGVKAASNLVYSAITWVQTRGAPVLEEARATSAAA